MSGARRRGRPPGRSNPLASYLTADDYVAKRRGPEQALYLAGGAEAGVLFARSLRLIKDAQHWMDSASTRSFLEKAGRDPLDRFGDLFREHHAESAGAAGGFARDLRDLLGHVEAVVVLHTKIGTRLRSDPAFRAALTTCSEERNMMVVFATRAARRAGVAEPTPMELAALAVRLEAGEHPAGSPEQKDARLDVFRKLKDRLVRIEKSLDLLLAPDPSQPSDVRPAGPADPADPADFHRTPGTATAPAPSGGNSPQT